MQIRYPSDSKEYEMVRNWTGGHSAQITLRDDGDRAEAFCSPAACYHYTPAEDFWKIINSETFFATNVKFTNDESEYNIGVDMVRGILNGEKPDGKDFYVICFCSDGNLLSQWREYGRIGVSMKLDFSRQSVFTMLNAANEGSPNESKIVFSDPKRVLYVEKGGNGEFRIDGIKNSREGKKIFGVEELRDGGNFSESVDYKKVMKNLVPYIKHGAFAEERESRLLFEINPTEAKKYLFYHNTDTYKKPYIKIQYGNKTTVATECKYINFDGKENSEVFKKAKDFAASKQTAFASERSSGEDEIFISEGNNQEELFWELDELLSGLENVKIWCDGHLPIREITVGPTLDKYMIRDSIRTYKNTLFWLKYASVEATDTPYKEKRE